MLLLISSSPQGLEMAHSDSSTSCLVSCPIWNGKECSPFGRLSA
jgi:hypothetical protein